MIETRHCFPTEAPINVSLFLLSDIQQLLRQLTLRLCLTDILTMSSQLNGRPVDKIYELLCVMNPVLFSAKRPYLMSNRLFFKQIYLRYVNFVFHTGLKTN